MDKPLIIQCNRMFTEDEIERYRQKIKEKMEDGVVILSPGYELVSVDVSLLEEIKREISEITYETDIDYTGKHLVYQTKCIAYSIIDKHIKELKGEQE